MAEARRRVRAGSVNACEQRPNPVQVSPPQRRPNQILVTGIRALPTRVTPLRGETVDGYLGRLAAVNATPPRELALYIAQALGFATTNTSAPRFVTGIERFGGLEVGHFARERPTLRLVRRCHHQGWTPCRCPKCDMIDLPRTACIVCSEGQPTDITARGGAFCIRHRRWHFQDENSMIGSLETHRHAEQIMTGRLWNRGVTMHTGEFGLALRLLADSFHDEMSVNQPQLARLYGAAVGLTFTMTDPAVASDLISHRESDHRQIEGLIGLTIGSGGGARTLELERTASDVIETHRHALREAMWMPNSPAAKFKIARFEKAIAESAFRHKAVLLRHVIDVRVRVDERTRGVRGVPASATVSRRLRPGWAAQEYPVMRTSARRISGSEGLADLSG